MHSFQSRHNVVRWKLVVRGEAEAWPMFERGFPIVVYPATMIAQAEVEKAVRPAVATPVLPVIATVGVRA